MWTSKPAKFSYALLEQRNPMSLCIPAGWSAHAYGTYLRPAGIPLRRRSHDGTSLRQSNLGQCNKNDREQRDQTATSARRFQQHGHLPLSWRKGKAGLGDLFCSMLTVAH
jgi:hypothetical protein